jgi:hypothetical protein
MTIALGIVASDGVILAADTQETYAGLFKLDQGKILAAAGTPLEKQVGGFGVTGAGSSVHLDSISQELCSAYLDAKSREPDVVHTLVKGRVSNFYREHIVPCSQLPEYERPSMQLLVGFHSGNWNRLWTTDKSVVRLCRYGAVGIGAAHANHMLSRLCPETMDVTRAVALAAYVLYYVKRHVDGCGNQSQIAVMANNRTGTFPPERVDVMEEQFGLFADTEKQLVHYALGFPVKDDVRAVHEIVNGLEHRRGGIATVFESGWVKAPYRDRDRPVGAWVDEQPPKKERRRSRK